MSQFVEAPSSVVGPIGVAAVTSSAVAGFPLESKTVVELDGIQTEILCSAFHNRIFITITQINKFGTFLHAWAEQKADGKKLYQVTTLLGKRDDPLLTIYARQIIEKLSAYSDKPVLLAISLQEEKGRSREQFQTILNRLFEIAVW